MIINTLYNFYKIFIGIIPSIFFEHTYSQIFKESRPLALKNFFLQVNLNFFKIIR